MREIIKLCTAMKIVTRIVKKAVKFLFHWKFQHYLEEHNAIYTYLSIYYEIR